ncbi:MAG: hypothetical protein HYS70_02980 [Nitrospinae bacterium]|nr:hypothetical protein [Nitrospinota bacterium]
MLEELDSLIRTGLKLEEQIAGLTEQLSQIRERIARLMGSSNEYVGHGVMTRKWARVRWDININLLLDELPREALEYFKEVVITKEKLDHAVKAGQLLPRLYDRAVRKKEEGWNVTFKQVGLEERGKEIA